MTVAIIDCGATVDFLGDVAAANTAQAMSAADERGDPTQKFKFGSNGSLVGTTFAVSLAKDETRLLTSKTRVKVAGLQRQGSVKMKSENCVKPRMTESEGEVDKLKVLGGRRGNERPQDPNIMESWSGWCQTWSMNLVDGAASERRECLRWCC